MSDLRYNQLEKVAVVVATKTQTLASMTAGTVYTGILTPSPILDSSYDGVGGFGNTSITSTNSVLLVEKPTVALVTTNGDYFINYKTGYYYIKAGASATPVLTWRVKVLEYNATGVTVTVGAVTTIDGGNVVEGSLADAAVYTDAAGSLSAKLRGLVKIFADIWDSTNHLFHVDLPTATVTTLTPLAAGHTVTPIPNGTGASGLSAVDSASKEASHVVKASAGILYHIRGYSDSTQYILIFDSATVPIDTTVAKIIIPVSAGGVFSEDFGSYGKVFSNGISWSNSSTIPAKTIGSADCLVNSLFK
jgi:hypothetical protein